MNAAGAWMGALLRLYPREFRERFGSEMHQTFTDAFSEQHTMRARVHFLARSIVDAVRTAASEWSGARVPRPSAPPPGSSLSGWPHAFRHALRSLRRNPGYAFAAILTLAAGIGGTVAVFSAMSAALLNPLPYPNAPRLVALAATRKGAEMSFSYLDLRDLQAQTQTFQSIGAYSGRSFTWTRGQDADRVRGEIVSANLFATLGVHPALGHDFSPADDDAGAPRIIAISHSLWMQRFTGDSSVIGQSMVLDGESYSIVAVMPPGFRFPDGIVYGPSDLWTPLARLSDADRADRGSHPGLAAVALLRPGASREQSSADMSAIIGRLATQYPNDDDHAGVVVRDAIDTIVGSLRSALMLLFGAALLVLLIACANVGGLMLARADARRRELAIKAALGATGMRVVANLAAEGLIVVTAGGAAGTALAYGLIRTFGRSLASLPRLDALTVDARALGYAAALTMTVGLVCSIAPGLWSGRFDTQRWLNARGVIQGFGTRLRNGFVVGQIAMSVMLLIAAGLLLRTFERLSADSGGVRPDNVITFALQLPDARYDQPKRITFERTLTERFAAQPGVSHVGVISVLPFSGGGAQSGIVPVGGSREDERRTDVAAVTPDYFAALGVDVVRGRVFTAADGENGVPVAVVDEQFAAAFWPGDDPVGKRVSGWGRPEWTVIGVVRHVKNYGVSAESRQEMYVPYTQRPLARLWYVVQTKQNPALAIAAARTSVKELDAELPLMAARPMRDVVDATVAGPRLSAVLSAGYALTALLVVIVGIHGALAYLVQRRTREIGVRMALGARAGQMLGLVVRHAFRLTALGVVIGVAGSVAASRVIRGQLYGVAPLDLASFGTAVLAMLCVGVAASVFPAWRASRVSPMTVLSEE